LKVIRPEQMFIIEDNFNVTRWYESLFKILLLGHTPDVPSLNKYFISDMKYNLYSKFCCWVTLEMSHLKLNKYFIGDMKYISNSVTKFINDGARDYFIFLV